MDSVFTFLWVVYGLSTLMAFWLFWRFTRWKGKARYFSGLVRVLFVAFMATPAHLSTVPDSMAPAFVVVLFDSFQGFDGVFDASVNLVAALIGSFLLYSIVFLIFYFVHFRRKS